MEHVLAKLGKRGGEKMDMYCIGRSHEKNFLSAGNKSK
jgi:hypothetical protein